MVVAVTKVALRAANAAGNLPVSFIFEKAGAKIPAFFYCAEQIVGGEIKRFLPKHLTQDILRIIFCGLVEKGIFAKSGLVPLFYVLAGSEIRDEV